MIRAFTGADGIWYSSFLNLGIERPDESGKADTMMVKKCAFILVVAMTCVLICSCGKKEEQARQVELYPWATAILQAADETAAKEVLAGVLAPVIPTPEAFDELEKAGDPKVGYGVVAYSVHYKKALDTKDNAMKVKYLPYLLFVNQEKVSKGLFRFLEDNGGQKSVINNQANFYSNLSFALFEESKKQTTRQGALDYIQMALATALFECRFYKQKYFYVTFDGCSMLKGMADDLGTKLAEAAKQPENVDIRKLLDNARALRCRQ